MDDHDRMFMRRAFLVCAASAEEADDVTERRSAHD